MKSLSVAAVIVAAGSSRRLQGDVPKQWRSLGGVPMIAYSFRFFDALPAVNQLVIALDKESLHLTDRTRWLESVHGKSVTLVEGDLHRQATVWLALQALNPEPDVVLIHDAARPFPPQEGVEQCIETARTNGGAILAMPVIETIKRVSPEGDIIGTIERNHLWGAQTPQGFLHAPLMSAYRSQENRLEQFTDDAGIFESNGGQVRVVKGSYTNFKVTTTEDFARAEQVIHTMTCE